MTSTLFSFKLRFYTGCRNHPTAKCHKTSNSIRKISNSKRTTLVFPLSAYKKKKHFGALDGRPKLSSSQSNVSVEISPRTNMRPNPTSARCSSPHLHNRRSDFDDSFSHTTFEPSASCPRMMTRWSCVQGRRRSLCARTAAKLRWCAEAPTDAFPSASQWTPSGHRTSSTAFPVKSLETLVVNRPKLADACYCFFVSGGSLCCGLALSCVFFAWRSFLECFISGWVRLRSFGFGSGPMLVF